jgi:dephospho-CoA kinase
MKKFYITGTSGVGKSAVAIKLQESGIPSVDMDKIDGLCRWVNKKTKRISSWYPGIGYDFLESHEYLCNKEKLTALMSAYKGIIVVVGYADNYPDFLDLFDKIFLFHCDEDVFIKRIENRIDNDFGKHSSEKKVLLDWYRGFESDMLKRGAIPINTTEPVYTVVDKVIEYIKL